MTRGRSLVIEHRERRLSVWIEDQNQRDMPVNAALIQEKARSLFEALKREQGKGAKCETFGASRGQFARSRRATVYAAWGRAAQPRGPARRRRASARRCCAGASGRAAAPPGRHSAWTRPGFSGSHCLPGRSCPRRASRPLGSKMPEIS